MYRASLVGLGGLHVAERHPLDDMVDRIKAQLQREVAAAQRGLRSNVRVGEVRLTKQEQLREWLRLSPAARQMLAQQQGPVETFMHNRAMFQEMFKRLGPAAAPLVEYIAPYLETPLGELEGGMSNAER